MADRGKLIEAGFAIFAKFCIQDAPRDFGRAYAV